MKATLVGSLLTLVSPLLISSPARAQFVVGEDSDNLGIDDVAITPNGLLAVARENSLYTSARVYDLAAGAMLADLESTPGDGGDIVQDAVACSDDRAIVIGTSALILDLNDLSAPLAEHDVALWPFDVALTPDGALAVVRGGRSDGPRVGGQFIFDMATGAQIAFTPGEPRTTYFDAGDTFDVDSVVVSQDHAVCTNEVGSANTRVTAWELRPSGGGPPVVVYETVAGEDQLGAPHDLALTPDGTHVAVRSEFEVGLYRLDGAQSGQLWHHGLAGNPGPFGLSAMDSIEVTDYRIATISRWSNGGFGTQVAVFNRRGAQKRQRILGDPHDLALTSENQLVVRTHLGVHLYDLAILPPGPDLTAIAQAPLPGTNTSFASGLDSVSATDECAVTLSRVGPTCDIVFWDISQGNLIEIGRSTMPDRPVDVELTPDGTRVAVSGTTYAMVFDMRTGDLVFEHDPESGGEWPWCDGVAVNDNTLVAFGLTDAAGGATWDGWLTIVDLFSDPTNYCAALPNSTGAPSVAFASGSSRVAANDLTLRATPLPPNQVGFFVYGQLQTSTPFGDGVLCVGSPTSRIAVRRVDPDGVFRQDIDYASLPTAITAGTTWNFQLIHRDVPQSGSTGVNLSDGLTITFTN